MYEIRLVCEGPTDRELLEGVLRAHLGDADYVMTVLQPDMSLYGGAAGPHGGGWKGVRGWCRTVASAGGMVAAHAVTPATDLLVIHVDGDVCFDREIGMERPCPPAQLTIAAVEEVVLGWLGLKCLPDRVVLWIPTMATESWALRALFPEHPLAVSCRDLPAGSTCVECLPVPSSALIGKTPRLVRRKDGQIKKLLHEYRTQQPQISAAWDQLISDLESADHLKRQLDRWLPAGSRPLPHSAI